MQKNGSQVKEDTMGRPSFKTGTQMWDISLIICNIRGNFPASYKKFKGNLLNETLGAMLLAYGRISSMSSVRVCVCPLHALAL